MQFGLDLFSIARPSPQQPVPLSVWADGDDYLVTANAGLDIHLDYDGDGDIDATMTAAQAATLVSAPVNIKAPSLVWREGDDGSAVGDVIEIDPGDWVYLESNTGKVLTWRLRVQGGDGTTLATAATSYAITASEQGQTLELYVEPDDSGAGGPTTATATVSVPVAAGGSTITGATFTGTEYYLLSEPSFPIPQARLYMASFVTDPERTANVLIGHGLGNTPCGLYAHTDEVRLRFWNGSTNDAVLTGAGTIAAGVTVTVLFSVKDNGDGTYDVIGAYHRSDTNEWTTPPAETGLAGTPRFYETSPICIGRNPADATDVFAGEIYRAGLWDFADRANLPDISQPAIQQHFVASDGALVAGDTARAALGTPMIDKHDQWGSGAHNGSLPAFDTFVPATAI